MKKQQTVLGPFSRIEGDLEIRLEGDGKKITSAYITAPMFRGFEEMLVGRNPLDALVIAPRVCGICSVSQSLAAQSALAKLAGVSPPKNAHLAFNLMQGTENLSDLFAHFYLYFMPDLVQVEYQNRDWYPAVESRFKTGGSSWKKALEIRSSILGMLSPLAGKWPHSLAMHPNGLTKTISQSERAELSDSLSKVIGFLETETYGCSLDIFLGLKTASDLEVWVKEHKNSDLGMMLSVAFDEGWAELGKIDTPMMSFGAYEQDQGEGQSQAVASGFFNERLEALDTTNITEDLFSSWLVGPKKPLHPEKGVTELSQDQSASDEKKYSYNKAPRYGGQVISVGPLARQVIDKNQLATSMNDAWGQSVLTRVLARWIEVARLCLLMRGWLAELDPQKSFFTNGALNFANGQAHGLIEAARGSLGHFIEVEKGKISRYQIVAPTSWNFSPRDASGQAGACEQALIGLGYEGAKVSPELWMVVRSFDPCMQCTVH
ncbi:MAG: nickel-dependent hydrogenase large subunit [SAR324 cluster bacterium]|nr:nickel-dependent hydrogenase large subunit [SAR324 cluster bacterium]